MIKDQAGNTKAEAVVLMTYFGRHPGQSIAGFNEEIKALKPDDKKELVEGATKALGYTIE